MTKIMRGKDLISNAETANTFTKRLVGLLGRSTLRETEGLLLNPCRQIHTMFMQFSIDVVFLDKEDKIIYLLPAVRAWRISSLMRKAESVLELPSGTIKKYKLQIGEILTKNREEI